jgi:TolB protein
MKKIMMCGLILILPAIVLLAWPKTTASYRLTLVTEDPTGGGDGAISPDATKFIISSKRTGNWELWAFDLVTNKWSQLTNHPADDFEGRWSPDGKQVVFCSTRQGQKNIWLLTVATGETKQLTFAKDDEEYPAWSSDGKQIVYTSGPWGSRDFYVIAAEGGEPRKVSRQSGMAGACMFEPKGDSLICHRYDLGSGNLIRLWLDTGEVTPLTVGNENWDYKPTTSSDNRWIAFSRSTEGPSHVWLMSTADNRAHQLTQSPDDDRWPTWNAEGDRLFFHRLVDRGTAIKVLDRRTGSVRTLVTETEGPLQASFDPEGKRIVYASQIKDRKVIKILDIRTLTSRTVDTGGNNADYPRWSPDGRSIAFVTRSPQRREVAVIQTDGSRLRLLTTQDRTLHGINGPIDWSPDNSKIVFHADTRPFEAALYTVDVQNGHVERITDGAWFDESPSFTSDGKGVVFMSTRGGNWTWGLFRLSLNDRSLKTLVQPDWVEKNYPRVTNDGSTVWTFHDEHDSELLAERSDDGTVHVLSQAGTGVRWASYSKDGTLILFTQMTHKVEYWLAENVAGSGSPLRDSSTSTVEGQAPRLAEEAMCQAKEVTAKLSRSPFGFRR